MGKRGERRGEYGGGTSQLPRGKGRKKIGDRVMAARAVFII
jgi:hypothetical protein